MFSDAAIEELVKLDVALMSKLAGSVPGGRQIMVEGTGHYVHVDKPEILIAPVVEMIKRVKEKEGVHKVALAPKRMYIICILIVWDPEKAHSNLKKHGVRLSDAEAVLMDPWAISVEDETAEGERRYVSIGTDAVEL
jgi:hypothetical protein